MRVDVVDLRDTRDEFRGRVLREGIAWNVERPSLARRALDSLAEVCALPAPTKIERDAAIQRFEYTFEAVWKAAQRFLSVVEGAAHGSPKTVIRASAAVGLAALSMRSWSFRARLLVLAVNASSGALLLMYLYLAWGPALDGM